MNGDVAVAAAGPPPPFPSSLPADKPVLPEIEKKNKRKKKTKNAKISAET